MIYDKETGQVLVLDKEKKKGWEGLTFPGGHVELEESIYESCVREVKEETGLDVEDLKLSGIVHWESTQEEKKEIGFLYYTDSFSGKLIDECDEGELFWMDLDEFINCQGKSDSMDDMLKVYLNKDIKEAMAYVGKGKLEFEFY